MTLADFKIVGIMRRRNLDDTGPLRRVRVLIRDDRDRTVHDRQHHLPPDQTLVPLILRIHRERRIAQHRLRARGREFQELRRRHRSVLIDQRILDVPEVTLLLLIHHLRIGNRGLALRAPVHNPAPLVDPALLMHFDEDFRDRPVAALVHREPLPVPVTRRTQLLQLRHNPVAIHVAPLPALFEEPLAAEVRLRDPLLLQLIDHLHLSRDRGVVRARLPQCLIPLHPAKPDNNILHRLVQSMPHVQLPRDIRRRDHNRERLLAVVHHRMKIFLILPVPIDPVLNPARIIHLIQLSAHTILPAAAARSPLLCRSAACGTPVPHPAASVHPVKRTPTGALKRPLRSIHSAEGVRHNAVPPLFTQIPCASFNH